jgi:hypothetical protein
MKAAVPFAAVIVRSATTTKAQEDDMRKRNRRVLPACLPDDILHDGIDFTPTWEENRLAYHRQQIALALAEVKRIELEEQRAWLEGQTRRIALVALEIDEYKRRAALHDEMDRQDKWWADTAEREKAQTEALMAHFQSVLDQNQFEKMKARAAKAGEDIKRDNARIERLELMRRGMVRGLRKR